LIAALEKPNERLITCLADVTSTQHLLAGCWGGSYLAAAVVCHVLADSEAKGRLGTELCKTLNLGLVGLELTSRSVLTVLLLQGGFCHPWVGYGAVGSSVATAVFCVVQYLTGKLR
jgi:hypothetical protein